ncbi:MAG TPA: PilZ domain-containing protein [Kofleriaceae bacterium]|nr:PilZ domain-containing protein [Kofleriaceae bacterium]
MSKPHDTSGEAVETDRRQQIRVAANGSVIVYGHGTARGRLSNVSSGGMLVRLGDGESPCGWGEDVEVELHLDRSGATWLRFRGEVVRSEPCAIAISFTSVPLDFADVVQAALSATLEGASLPHVLLVDSNTQRRAPFAALLRRAGCRVAEVTTPLEAIAHLGGSAIHSWVVAIASTVPANTADELQRFLAESDASVDVRMLGTKSPTSALAWFTATARPG